jgi:cold shock CspA family protein
MYASLFFNRCAGTRKIEALRSELRKIFDPQGIIMFPIHSLIPQQAAGNALAAGFNKGRGPGSMPKGKVKWFSERIGAGFIRTEEGKDVFFNIKAIHDSDPQIMQRGQCVSFDILKNENRIPLLAANVKTIESSACALM